MLCISHRRYALLHPLKECRFKLQTVLLLISVAPKLDFHQPIYSTRVHMAQITLSCAILYCTLDQANCIPFITLDFQLASCPNLCNFLVRNIVLHVSVRACRCSSLQLSLRHGLLALGEDWPSDCACALPSVTFWHSAALALHGVTAWELTGFQAAAFAWAQPSGWSRRVIYYFRSWEISIVSLFIPKSSGQLSLV